MVRFTRSRSSPRQAASRLAAIRVLVTLGHDEEDLDSTTTALRLLGVSDGELYRGPRRLDGGTRLGLLNLQSAEVAAVRVRSLQVPRRIRSR